MVVNDFRSPYFRPVSPLHIDYPHCSTDLVFPTASDEVDGPRAVLLDSDGRPAVVSFGAGVGFAEFSDQQAVPIRNAAAKAAQAAGEPPARALTPSDGRNFVHEISADEVYALKAAVWTRREYEQFAVKLKQERASSSTSNSSSAAAGPFGAAAAAQGAPSGSAAASASNVSKFANNNNNSAETGSTTTTTQTTAVDRIGINRRLSSSSSAFSVFNSSSSSASPSSQNLSSSAGTSTRGLPPAAVDSASPLVTTTSTTVTSLTYGIPTSLISPTSSTSSLMNGTGRTQINGNTAVPE